MGLSKRTEAWEALAARVGGQLSAGLFQNPSIEFSVGENPARIEMNTVGPDQALPWSQVMVRIGDPGGLRFRVWPEKLAQKISKLLGAQDVELGDAEFDKRFMVSTTDPQRVVELLADEAVKRRLLAMRDAQIELSSDPQRPTSTPAPTAMLRVAWRGIDQDAERLAALADFAEYLVERLRVG